MQDYLDKSLALMSAGASQEAQLMALIVGWHHEGREHESAARDFLAVSDWAARRPQDELPMLAELRRFLDLDRRLPAGLRVLDRALPPAAADQGAAWVKHTVEAKTPLLTSTLPFAMARSLGDNPEKWASASPQINDVKFTPLPAKGALWRGRLSKKTDLATPLVTDLVSEETIEITARGEDGAGGLSGRRTYGYTFVSSKTGPGLQTLTDDSGFIHIRGDEHGTVVQIKKRVTVLRPADDPLGKILSIGFSALLWLWATGFLNAAGAPVQKPAPAPTPPTPDKKIVAAGNEVSVAVLGGGPAGLACAWLLSNPMFNNQSAWQPPTNRPLKVNVTLVEKQCRPGGKAASGRRTDTQNFRIEEHGLHVLMGFYANVLRLMEWTGSTAALDNIFKTRIPLGDGADPEDAWCLTFRPWPKATSRATLATWFERQKLKPEWTQCEWRDLDLEPLFAFDRATRNVRPLLRAFVELSRQAAVDNAAIPSARDRPSLLALALPWLLSRVIMAELDLAFRITQLELKGVVAAGSQSSDVAPLARLLRYFARGALPANSPRPEVRRASELIELATTIAVGLDEAELFPRWAVDDPGKLVKTGYAAWVRGMQTQDARSLTDWLVHHEIAQDFCKRSRLLESVTAGLFTSPDQIAAGTFVNGFARLLLTYGDAPYMRMQGGTGEALIGPIYAALKAKEGSNVTLMLGTESMSVKATNTLLIETEVKTGDLPEARDFARWGPATLPGWRKPLTSTKGKEMTQVIKADAFVLAIPPFGGPLAGLPTPLAGFLAGIESRATIGLQHWTDGEARYKQEIVSGLGGALRCAASMDHLAEGSGFGFAPVYACGDVENDVAARWRQDYSERDAWLATNAAKLQQGGTAHEPYVSVNDRGSERYVSANLATQAARRYGYDTGLQNLWLAGDWTRSALSCGSIEAAFTSGLEAARDILETLGCTVEFPITGAIIDKGSP